jgi:addiction module HigA family antidote
MTEKSKKTRGDKIVASVLQDIELVKRAFDSDEHPGKILQKLMEMHGVDESQVADRSNLSRAQISLLVGESRRVTATTALLLGKFFGVEPSLWTDAQARYDLKSIGDSCDIKARLHKIVPLDKAS